MKRVFLSIAAVLFSTLALAQEGSRIGVFDADVVIQESAKGKAFFAEYQALIKTKQDELRAVADALQAAQKDAQARAASMSEEQRREVTLDLERRQTELKRRREDAERETQSVLSERLEEFREELVPLIRQVAMEKGLDLVINSGPQSNLVYISERINITRDVIASYDGMQ